jgi:acyl carrier protein
MRKFIDRGWTISAGQVLKMAFQIKDLNLYDVLTLKEQLIGVDSVYFLELLSLIEKELKENPLREDFSLDYSLLANLIDNLF